MAGAVVWRKIAKIAGMLGSDQDGEALAAARAIGKLLAAENLSWPDFSRRLWLDLDDESIGKPPPPPRKRKPPPPKPQRREPNIGRAGYPYWRHDVDRLTVWALCLARTDRGVSLMMSHRPVSVWLPRRFVWRNYVGQPLPDEEWQEWSIERWIVDREQLADVLI